MVAMLGRVGGWEDGKQAIGGWFGVVGLKEHCVKRDLISRIQDQDCGGQIDLIWTTVVERGSKRRNPLTLPASREPRRNFLLVGEILARDGGPASSKY